MNTLDECTAVLFSESGSCSGGSGSGHSGEGEHVFTTAETEVSNSSSSGSILLFYRCCTGLANYLNSQAYLIIYINLLILL